MKRDHGKEKYKNNSEIFGVTEKISTLREI